MTRSLILAMGILTIALIAVPERAMAAPELVMLGNTLPVAYDAVLGGLVDSGAIGRFVGPANAGISVTNRGDAPVSSFTVVMQMASDASGSDAINVGSATFPGVAAGVWGCYMPGGRCRVDQFSMMPGLVTGSIPYTISAGTHYYRPCVDQANTVAESNEDNNCNNWAAVRGVDIPSSASPSCTNPVWNEQRRSPSGNVSLGTGNCAVRCAEYAQSTGQSVYCNSTSNTSGWAMTGPANVVPGGSGPCSASTQPPVYQPTTGGVVNSAGMFHSTRYYATAQACSVPPALPPPPTNASASCNASGTNATLSWTAAPGATAYYLRISKPSGSSCPAGFQTAPWESTQCIPNPDWFQGTSVNYPVTPSSNYSLWVYAANGSGYNPTPAGTTFSCATQCSDGADNDDDSHTDYPADPGCSSAADTSESPNPPVATLSNNGPIAPNTSATLTYTCTNSTSATIQGIGSVTPVSGGTAQTPQLTATTPYNLTCTAADGATANRSTTVVVTDPRPYLKASPDRVNADGTSYLSWSASGLTPSSSCSMTKNGAPFTPGAPGILAADTLGAIATTSAPGVAQSIPSQTVYKLTCGSAVSTAIVNVVPRFEEF